MKKLLIAFVLIGLLAAGCDEVASSSQQAFFPEPTGYVVDNTNTLKPETKTAVEADLKAFDPKAQLAVVIVQTIAPLDIEGYGIKLAEKFKVGHTNTTMTVMPNAMSGGNTVNYQQNNDDDGAILIIAKDERKVRIEVGRGLESTLTDAKTGEILDNCVVPSLKNNNYDDAVTKGVACIEKEIK